MTPRTRKLLLWLHTWTGLVVGGIVTCSAVTGALLVLRPRLERALDPDVWVVRARERRVPLDEIVANAEKANPGGVFESLRFFGDPTLPVLVYFEDERFVHVDPYTGAVLGIRRRYGDGFGWLAGLHKYLHLPHKIGEPITGVAAGVFSFVALTGAVLWWPSTRRALLAGLTLQRRLTGRAWQLNLHRTIGAYVAVILFFSAATGCLIDFELLRGAAPRPAPPADPGASFVGFEALAARWREVAPDAREVLIAAPARGMVSTYAIAADAPHPNARSYLWFHRGTGTVLGERPHAAAPLGYRLHYWLVSLHLALVGGSVWATLLFLGAASVPLLGYTGLSSYLARKRKTAPASS